MPGTSPPRVLNSCITTRTAWRRPACDYSKHGRPENRCRTMPSHAERAAQNSTTPNRFATAGSCCGPKAV